MKDSVLKSRAQNVFFEDFLRKQKINCNDFLLIPPNMPLTERKTETTGAEKLKAQAKESLKKKLVRHGCKCF